jgi:hypothetical protein
MLEFQIVPCQACENPDYEQREHGLEIFHAGIPFRVAPNTRIKPPPARDGCFVSCPTPAVGLNELLAPKRQG